MEFLNMLQMGSFVMMVGTGLGASLGESVMSTYYGLSYGIWRGLKLLWDTGQRCVVLETNLQVVVCAILNQHSFYPNYDLIVLINVQL